MIVLIAPETDISNELEILHQLFQEGLQFYHLRKPHKNYKEHCDYLNRIDKKYHNRIVTHYFHELINEFDLKGIHFQEKKRQNLFKNAEFRTQNLVKKDFIKFYSKILDSKFSILNSKSISSSFHEPKELEQCDFEYDYYLLSPVFSSISKQGYQGRGFNVNGIDKTIIGMGGVTTNNLSEFHKLGFKGVGVLGGIWNSENPIEDFVKMHAFFNVQLAKNNKQLK